MGIKTTIGLYNQMTPVLNEVIGSMYSVIDVAENIERSTGKMLNTEKYSEMRTQLEQTSRNLSKMEFETQNVTKEHRNYNREIKNSNNALDGIIGKAKALVTTYLGVRGVNLFVDKSDQMANIRSRLNLITKSNQETKRLEETIYNMSQRTYTNYTESLDIVTKLGLQASNAFNNNAELVKFTEQLQKHLAVAGTDAEGVRSVMYNLTQAMAMGVVRGQDYNAIISNAQPLIQTVADYLGVGVEEMKELADSGQITAEVFKNALLKETVKIDSQMGNMALTFGKLWQSTTNAITRGFSNSFAKFTELLNSEDLKEFHYKVTRTAEKFGDIFLPIIGAVGDGFLFITDNAETLLPILASILTMATLWKIQTQLLTIENLKLFKSYISNPYTLAIAGAVLMLSLLAKYYTATGQAKDITEALAMASEKVAIGVLAIGTSILILKGLFFGFQAVATGGMGIILAMIGAGIFLLIRWAQKVGGLNVAWRISSDYIQTKIEEIILAGVRAKNFFSNIPGEVILSSKRLSDSVVITVNKLWTNIKNITQNGIIWSKNRLNDFIGLLNKVPGVNLKFLDVATNKANIELNNKLQKKLEARKEQEYKHLLEETRTKQKEREEAYQELKLEYDNKQRERQIRIAEAREEAQRKAQEESQANLLEQQVGEGSELFKQIEDINKNTSEIKDSIDWDNNNLDSLRDLMEYRAVKELSKEVKIEISNEFSGNVSSDVDVNYLKDEVTNRIVEDLEIWANA